MLLACTAAVCPDLLLPQALDFVKRAGFDSIELDRTRTESSPVHPDSSVRQVREHLQASGIRLSGLNIRNLSGRKADSDERNLGYNLRQLEWDIHLGRALGLKTVNLRGGERSDEALKDLIDGVNQLLERIPDITLNLGSCKGNRLQGLEDFQAVVPHLDKRAKVLLDTGHLLAAGEDVMDCARAFADRIGLVYLRDQRGAKPVQFGQGDLPLKDLLHLLHTAGYAGYLAIALEEVDWDEPLRATVAAREYTQDLLHTIQSKTRKHPMKNITINDFRDYPRDRFIDAQTSAAAQLSPTLHLTHESGVEGTIREKLDDTCWSKVVFDIPSANLKGAELLFYVNSDSTTQEKPMRLLVNGHRLSHRQDLERKLTGGWDRTRIPARLLKNGRNEFIFSHSGVLHVDPGPGGHSSRSFDGGKTWHKAALGPNNDVCGDYMVRLRLQGYAPSGQLTSPFIDLADPGHEGLIAPHLNSRKVRLTSQARTPEGTRIQFEMRSGSTPAFEPRSWTPWERKTSLDRPGRFVQFRATLSTQSADTTPSLESATLQVDGKEDKAALTNFKLLELDHPEIVRSSYEFTYMAPHPRLDRLRKQYRLEEVVAPGKTELEKFALLRDWVHSQWLGWQADKYPYCPPWDPLEILETTKGNWGFGMCTHYGAVFTGCAAALGYVARVLVVNHHCLAEIWSEDLQKWILQDPGPGREHDATYESRGVPVNALEFHYAFMQKKARYLKINKLPYKATAPMTQEWGGLFIRFGIPPRNNHLVYAEPAELRHGYQQYHYDGYLWWSVDIDPKFAEYSLQTSRPGDFYWSVNQTRLYLQVGTAPDTLQVDLESVTPNFSHFLVQLDDGEWEKQQAPLQWKLHPGENKLAVRSENVFGKQGRIARARVDCKA